MRKITALMMVAILMLGVVSYAETEPIDLSNMSLEELITLRNQINMLIDSMEKAEPDEISLKEGIYLIGVDIPAGSWNVRPADGGWTDVQLGREYIAEDNLLKSKYSFRVLVSESSLFYEDGKTSEIDFDFIEGTYCQIKYGAAVLSNNNVKTENVETLTKSVTVPQGVYEIGVDIPEGHWDITAAPGQFSLVTWTHELDESKKKKKDMNSLIYDKLLVSKTCKTYDLGDVEFVDLDLFKDTYLIISSGDVIFTPYSGKPDLGF